jgi:hypothetical protein
MLVHVPVHKGGSDGGLRVERPPSPLGFNTFLGQRRRPSQAYVQKCDVQCARRIVMGEEMFLSEILWATCMLAPPVSFLSGVPELGWPTKGSFDQEREGLKGSRRGK